MADSGVQVMLTGNIGLNAFQTFKLLEKVGIFPTSAAGIQTTAGVTGMVREAIGRFNSGQLQPVTGATVPEYFSVRTVCLETEDDEFA